MEFFMKKKTTLRIFCFETVSENEYNSSFIQKYAIFNGFIYSSKI